MVSTRLCAKDGVSMQIESLEFLQSEIGPDAWRRLSGFLESVRHGQPVDYVTPYFPKEQRNRGKAYVQELLPMFLTGIPELDDLERREAEKFGPYSIRLPWAERRGSVQEYFFQKEVKSSISLRKAFQTLSKLIPAHSLRSLSLDEAYRLSPKGKNLGLPEFTSSRTFEDSYLRRAKRIEASGYLIDIFDAVLGWRGQPNGTNRPKQRVVMMMDHAETYISTSVIQVLLGALRSLPGFAAWNDLRTVDHRVTRIIDRAVAPILSVDFSGFDRSLPATVIRFAFELMRYWFVSSDKAKIDWMERQFLNVGVVTPDGIYIGRDGGVSSGDGATNMVDSVAQLIMLFAAALDLGLTVRDVEVLGDDGIYSFDQEIDPEVFSEYYRQLYGMEISHDKGGYSRDMVMFLQRMHLRGYRRNGLTVGVRSIMRTLNGMMHLERLNKGLPPEFFTARALMQGQQAEHHPHFRRLVSWMFRRDRYLKTLTPQEIFRRAGGTSEVERVLGLQSYRFGTELPSKGLSNFSIVKELDRLRGRKADSA